MSLKAPSLTWRPTALPMAHPWSSLTWCSWMRIRSCGGHQGEDGAADRTSSTKGGKSCTTVLQPYSICARAGFSALRCAPGCKPGTGSCMQARGGEKERRAGRATGEGSADTVLRRHPRGRRRLHFDKLGEVASPRPLWSRLCARALCQSALCCSLYSTVQIT